MILPFSFKDREGSTKEDGHIHKTCVPLPPAPSNGTFARYGIESYIHETGFTLGPNKKYHFFAHVVDPSHIRCCQRHLWLMPHPQYPRERPPRVFITANRMPSLRRILAKYFLLFIQGYLHIFFVWSIAKGIEVVEVPPIYVYITRPDLSWKGLLEVYHFIIVGSSVWWYQFHFDWSTPYF